MKDMPVWIDTKICASWQQYFNSWERVRDGKEMMDFWEFGEESENSYVAIDYGKTWLAYARKPTEN
jgi:hypothetical protein